MCLEESCFAVLIERELLQVKAWGIDMSRCEVNALFDRLCSDNCKDNSLSSVVEIDLIACFKAHSVCEFLKSALFGEGDSLCNGFSFDLCIIKKCFVILTEVKTGLDLVRGKS